MQDSAKTQVVKEPTREELFDRKKSRQYAAEFLGTFLLVLTYEAMSERVNYGHFNAELSSMWLFMGALTVGGMAAILVYLHQWISGAHFNPAVTFGVMFRFNMVRKGPLLIYILMQLLAAAGAAILFNYFFSHAKRGNQIAAAKNDRKASIQEVEVHVGPNMAVAFVSEFIFTFLLITAYFITIYNRKLRGNQFYGFVIGTVYAIAIIVIGPGTGGVLNPAIWFGTIVQRYIFNKHGVSGWVYLGAHVTAALVAALLQRTLLGDEIVNSSSTSNTSTTKTKNDYVEVNQNDNLAGGIDNIDNSKQTDSHVISLNDKPSIQDAEYFFKKFHQQSNLGGDNANLNANANVIQDQLEQKNRVVPNSQFQYQQ